MDAIWDKIGAIVAAIITALGGMYMYDRKTTHERITRLESEVSSNTRDIAVTQESIRNIKEDTEEIKASQQDIIKLLTNRRK